MFLETKDPTKLRKRVQWLRRRELELLGRVFGPRYELDETLNARFIGHIGDWDSYFVSEFTNCQVWLVKHTERAIVPLSCIKAQPAIYPLHAAVLELASLQAKELAEVL
jgi:hypothetical protein